MNDRQLLQQALDALTCNGEDDDPGHRCAHCDDYVDRNGPLRAALRERLAQCDRCGKKLGGEGDIHTCTPDPIGDAQDRLIAELAAQPEQEPVCDKDPQGCWNVRCQLGDKCKNTPPAARTWVDLTPDDIQNCYGGNVDDFARALLAKSKERNT